MQALFLKIFRPAQPTAIRKSGWPDYSSAHGHSQKRLLRSRRRLRGSSFASWIGRSAHTMSNAQLCTQASKPCIRHGMAELLHQVKYTDLIGLREVSQ